MGRMKGLFCSFCRNRSPDQSANDRSFSQGNDVSHLATPHVPSNQSLTHKSSSNTLPVGNCNDASNYHQFNTQQSQSSTNNAIQQQGTPELRAERREASDQDINVSSSSFQHQQDVNRPHIQPSPSPLNSFASSSHPIAQQEAQPHRNINGHVSIPLSQQQQQQPIIDQQVRPESSGLTTKLSYDIISVREPLAKILSERQQAQQQQRLTSGDHEYIEVYGERGSSCFYEEIAGSTTSSATYDQIGAPLNHNYQALFNAYAVANRPNDSQVDERSSPDHPLNINSGNSNHNEEYDNNRSADQVDHPRSSPGAIPTTSSNNHQNMLDNQSFSHQSSTYNERGATPSQSIPVYSVINKAARRSNAIIRATVDNCRPPEPPPKNLMMAPSTSAIHNYYSENSMLINSSRNSPQFPTTSSFINSSKNNVSELNESTSHSSVPKPPPRYSKHPIYNATSRPLPSLDNYDKPNNSTGMAIDRSQSNDDDIESVNNGYELLRSNLDDDQIDVGYEKIRESNRYSGGSLSSQFCPLQTLDNGGYESVQPIYSSPSNALAEPNYEAIGPATASELAAAATARLKAIEFFKQDPPGAS